MSPRAATSIAVLVGLALLRAGPCHALSLRSSAAEAALGDASPGASVVFSRATGARLRVEDAGREAVRLEFEIVSPRPDAVKDGYEPWPFPDRVRVTPARTEAKPGEAAEADLAVSVPKSMAAGGQYEFDVLATGRDRAGASLTLKTRTLLSIGAPLPPAAEPPGGFAERPGFQLSPASAEQAAPAWDADAAGAEFKIVNAGEEDLTVSLSPVREWDDEAPLRGGEEPAANPRWLRFDAASLKVRAGAIARARARILVPRERRYAGRKWAFVAAVEAEAGGRRTRRYFVLHATTPDLGEDARSR